MARSVSVKLPTSVVVEMIENKLVEIAKAEADYPKLLSASLNACSHIGRPSLKPLMSPSEAKAAHKLSVCVRVISLHLPKKISKP
jgi:hypothetical protein